MNDKIHKLNSSVVDFLNDRIEEGDGIIVQMKSGETYSIPDASPALLVAFVKAESPGQFFNIVIKPNFEIKKIKEVWLSMGVAAENIATGERVEYGPLTGLIRRMKLESLKKIN